MEILIFISYFLQCSAKEFLLIKRRFYFEGLKNHKNTEVLHCKKLKNIDGQLEKTSVSVLSKHVPLKRLLRFNNSLCDIRFRKTYIGVSSVQDHSKKFYVYIFSDFCKTKNDYFNNCLCDRKSSEVLKRDI